MLWLLGWVAGWGLGGLVLGTYRSQLHSQLNYPIFGPISITSMAKLMKVQGRFCFVSFCLALRGRFSLVVFIMVVLFLTRLVSLYEGCGCTEAWQCVIYPPLMGAFAHQLASIKYPLSSVLPCYWPLVIGVWQLVLFSPFSQANLGRHVARLCPPCHPGKDKSRPSPNLEQ